MRALNQSKWCFRLTSDHQYSRRRHGYNMTLRSCSARPDAVRWTPTLPVAGSIHAIKIACNSRGAGEAGRQQTGSLSQSETVRPRSEPARQPPGELRTPGQSEHYLRGLSESPRFVQDKATITGRVARNRAVVCPLDPLPLTAHSLHLISC